MADMMKELGYFKGEDGRMWSEFYGKKIRLPKKPPDEEILNYGQKPKDQIWRRIEEVDDLAEYYDEYYDTYLDKHKHFPDRIEHLTEEQELILKTHYTRRVNGLWVFIKGVAVWIPGDMYFFLQNCQFELANFRKFRIYQLHVFYTLELVMRSSVDSGLIFLKPRRIGGTEMFLAHILNRSTLNVRDKRIKMMSKVGVQAKNTLFEPLVHVFDTLPRFDQPLVKNKTLSKLFLDKPTKRITQSGNAARRSKKKKGGIRVTLECLTTSIAAMDGDKTYIQFIDEIFKMPFSAKRVIEISQPACWADGSGGRYGWQLACSTVSEIEDKWMDSYKLLWDESQESTRNETTGKTTSGLISLFIPASDTHGAFIDKYGITDKLGATHYHQAQMDQLEKSGRLTSGEGKEDGLFDYMKKFPLAEEQVWMDAGTKYSFGEFTALRIRNKIIELKDKNRKPVYKMGIIRFVNDNPESKRSVWVPYDPSVKEGTDRIMRVFDKTVPDAKIKLLKDPREFGRENWVEVNRKTGQLSPRKDFEFVAWFDPFRFDVTKGRQSLWSCHVFRHRRNSRMPGPTAVPYAHYLFRTDSVQKAYKDMLAIAVYWGALMGFERNTEGFKTYCENYNALGMLYHDSDGIPGVIPTTQWFKDSEEAMENWLAEAHDYTEQDNLDKLEVSEETLQQIGEYTPKKRKDLDAYVSCYGAIKLMNFLVNKRETDNTEQNYRFRKIWSYIAKKYGNENQSRREGARIG